MSEFEIRQIPLYKIMFRFQNAWMNPYSEEVKEDEEESILYSMLIKKINDKLRIRGVDVQFVEELTPPDFNMTLKKEDLMEELKGKLREVMALLRDIEIGMHFRCGDEMMFHFQGKDLVVRDVKNFIQKHREIRALKHFIICKQNFYINKKHLNYFSIFFWTMIKSIHFGF